MQRASTLVEREQEATGLSRRALLGSVGTLALGGAVLATPPAALAARNPAAGGCPAPTPAGFTKFLVYMAEGNAGSITDPDFVLAFQHEVYGRDEAAVAAYAREAMAFFLERFGLDFRDATAPTTVGPWEIDGAVMQGSVFSPANGYTAYVVSEEAVGPQGWIVRDSSFNARLTEDQTLHGTWGGAAGKAAKAESVVVFGDYNIKVDKPGASERGDTIQIHFESGSPIIGDVDGTFHFVCDLSHPDWGAGHARGVGTADGGVRNVITFPPSLP
jgi:hypothetical protein